MRKKQARSADSIYFDYKDVKTLKMYLTVYNQIESRYKTGLRETQQKRLSRAVKQARHLALLPFTNKVEF